MPPYIYKGKLLLCMVGENVTTSLLREAVNYFNHFNYLFKETIYSNT